MRKIPLHAVPLLLLAACSSETHKAGAGNPNAVGIALRVDNADGSRNVYLGAYSIMPSGALDKSQMVELGAEMVGFAFGWAFMYDNDSQILTRYTLGADGLPHKDDAELSFADVNAGGFISYAFVSPTRAYVFNDAQLSNPIVAWNPTTMTLIEHASMANLTLDTNQFDETYYAFARPFGNYQVTTMEADMDFATAAYTKARVMFIPNDSIAGTNPVFAVEDSRCGGSTALFVNSAGDLYVTGTSAYGSFQLYPNDAGTMPPACLLRIKKGTTEFDPSFYVNLLDKLNTKAIYQSWYVGDDKMLVLALQSGQTFTDISDFQANALYVPMLVDTQGNVKAVTGIPAKRALLTFKFRYNDRLLYHSYQGAIKNASVTVYDIGTEGTATELFETSGAEFWNVGELTQH